MKRATFLPDHAFDVPPRIVPFPCRVRYELKGLMQFFEALIVQEVDDFYIWCKFEGRFHETRAVVDKDRRAGGAAGEVFDGRPLGA